ncbi:unnamed protein product [Amoebophrya sp. A120]|nr:unnamed protein product [Amoebophrya sp. A120]|eukprot:GSA120T00023198001.1
MMTIDRSRLTCNETQEVNECQNVLVVSRGTRAKNPEREGRKRQWRSAGIFQSNFSLEFITILTNGSRKRNSNVSVRRLELVANDPKLELANDPKLESYCNEDVDGSK